MRKFLPVPRVESATTTKGTGAAILGIQNIYDALCFWESKCLYDYTIEYSIMVLIIIPHAIMEMTTRWIRPNTMISLWNMRTASAPIQATEAMVKYWIRREQAVQPISFSVRSIPTRKESNMKKMAIQSCTWNLLASFLRIFLKWKAICMYSWTSYDAIIKET